MLVDECICTYYDKYYEKKKQAQENLLKSVRDRLLSYIEMLPTALFVLFQTWKQPKCLPTVLQRI